MFTSPNIIIDIFRSNVWAFTHATSWIISPLEFDWHVCNKQIFGTNRYINSPKIFGFIHIEIIITDRKILCDILILFKFSNFFEIKMVK